MNGVLPGGRGTKRVVEIVDGEDHPVPKAIVRCFDVVTGNLHAGGRHVLLAESRAG